MSYQILHERDTNYERQNKYAMAHALTGRKLRANGTARAARTSIRRSYSKLPTQRKAQVRTYRRSRHIHALAAERGKSTGRIANCIVVALILLVLALALALPEDHTVDRLYQPVAEARTAELREAGFSV